MCMCICVDAAKRIVRLRVEGGQRTTRVIRVELPFEVLAAD